MYYPEITFNKFKRLAVKRRYSLDDLVEMFHGKLDENRAFFERVFSGRYADVVIPYRSVVGFFQQEKGLEHLKKGGLAT